MRNARCSFLKVEKQITAEAERRREISAVKIKKCQLLNFLKPEQFLPLTGKLFVQKNVLIPLPH